ncbi:MAG: hypothetical protein IPP17_29165 [Bacteroidetes bacterium]|nr:hypothetical protein [Bacteroidota bacterium]
MSEGTTPEHASYQNSGFEQHEIVAMQEAIDFQMDRYGARVTSVAMEIGADSAGMAPPVPKNLLLNKPYWVIMKQKTRQGRISSWACGTQQ